MGTSSVGRYVAIESAISVAINTALSIGFALAVFGGRSLIDLRESEVMIDMVPQSFMVAFMGTLVPTFLTRRRLAAGRIERPGGPGVLPRNMLVRALIMGVAAALVGTSLFALFGPNLVLSLPAFIVAKAVYGAALAAIVTPIAIRWVLRRR